MEGGHDYIESQEGNSITMRTILNPKLGLRDEEGSGWTLFMSCRMGSGGT